MRKLAAELLGTFALVFAGTGANTINDVSGGQVTHVGVALTFGLVVLAMIYAVGDVSGAHLNPAVTIGFFAAGRFEARWVAPYIACQLLGAVTASSLLRVMFPHHPTLGATLPAGVCAAVHGRGCCRITRGVQEADRYHWEPSRPPAGGGPSAPARAGKAGAPGARPGAQGRTRPPPRNRPCRTCGGQSPRRSPS